MSDNSDRSDAFWWIRKRSFFFLLQLRGEWNSRKHFAKCAAANTVERSFKSLVNEDDSVTSLSQFTFVKSKKYEDGGQVSLLCRPVLLHHGQHGRNNPGELSLRFLIHAYSFLGYLNSRTKLLQEDEHLKMKSVSTRERDTGTWTTLYCMYY